MVALAWKHWTLGCHGQLLRLGPVAASSKQAWGDVAGRALRWCSLPLKHLSGHLGTKSFLGNTHVLPPTWIRFDYRSGRGGCQKGWSTLPYAWLRAWSTERAWHQRLRRNGPELGELRVVSAEDIPTSAVGHPRLRPKERHSSYPSYSEEQSYQLLHTRRRRIVVHASMQSGLFAYGVIASPASSVVTRSTDNEDDLGALERSWFGFLECVRS